MARYVLKVRSGTMWYESIQADANGSFEVLMSILLQQDFIIVSFKLLMTFILS